MNNNDCNDCNDSPGPGSVVRLVGKDAGATVVLCSKCFIMRERDAAMPAGPQLKVKKAKGKQ